MRRIEDMTLEEATQFIAKHGLTPVAPTTPIPTFQDGSPIDPVDRILHGPSGLDLKRLEIDMDYQQKEMELPNGRWWKYKAALAERDASEQAAAAEVAKQAELKQIEESLAEEDRSVIAQEEARKAARLAEADRRFESAKPRHLRAKVK